MVEGEKGELLLSGALDVASSVGMVMADSQNSKN